MACVDSFPGGHSKLVPPDSISNSEVKRFCADDSVGPPHVKVGHRQVLFKTPAHWLGFFLCLHSLNLQARIRLI